MRRWEVCIFVLLFVVAILNLLRDFHHPQRNGEDEHRIYGCQLHPQLLTFAYAHTNATAYPTHCDYRYEECNHAHDNDFSHSSNVVYAGVSYYYSTTTTQIILDFFGDKPPVYPGVVVITLAGTVILATKDIFATEFKEAQLIAAVFRRWKEWNQFFKHGGYSLILYNTHSFLSVLMYCRFSESFIIRKDYDFAL